MHAALCCGLNSPLTCARPQMHSQTAARAVAVVWHAVCGMQGTQHL